MKKRVVLSRKTFVEMGSLMLDGNARLILSNGSIIQTSAIIRYKITPNYLYIETENSIYTF